MKNLLNAEFRLAKNFLTPLVWLTLIPAAALAQVPVDDNGEIIGTYEPQKSVQETGNEDIPLLSTVDLEELVSPVALYPDDLLAIVLPAAAYPLQIVEAGRFLEALENDSSLKPDPEWDDSVVALVNYPEVIELLNDDIDWTWRLGEAVVSQQADVVSAIETFRDRAYAAGNLKSDSYQNVSRDEGVIEITPVAEDVIYVPYYEPERVVVYQPRPVYYYYPRPYPVYYYPYSSIHAFDRGYFWGVTTAFTIGWYSDSLNVFHHSYHGHPYYGHSYWDRWWYRRPSVGIHNTTYVSSNTNITVNRYYGGDRWRPRSNRHDYVSDRRITRNRYYPSSRTERVSSDTQRVISQRQASRNDTQRRSQSRERTREPVAFRERPQTTAMNRREPVQFRNRSNSNQSNRTGSTDRRQQIARVAPRSTETALRTRAATTRQQHQTRQQQPREQRQAVQNRRVEPQERRSEPTSRQRRSEPQVQARRAEPTRQSRQTETRRQEKAERQSAPAAESRTSSQRKSGRRSERRR
jgi:hypothetical protein